MNWILYPSSVPTNTVHLSDWTSCMFLLELPYALMFDYSHKPINSCFQIWSPQRIADRVYPVVHLNMAYTRFAKYLDSVNVAT